MRFFNLTLLATAGIAFPTAPWALGLGNIQVQSALGQPLKAQVQIIGASADDLAGLRAGIAGDEIFRRFNAERPSFLSTTVVTAAQDEQGRPILLLRSTAPFNEPAVTLLVDLHSSSGELIREYTLLLDPPGLAHIATNEAPAVAEALPAPAAQDPSPAPSRELPRSAPAPQLAAAPVSEPARGTYKVAPHDTLDRIVRKAGARSRSDRHRMMVAIFRANAEAFGSNVNSLRSGVTLKLPSAAALASISPEEADRALAAQISAWHTARRRPEPQFAPAATSATDHVDVGSSAETTAPSIKTDDLSVDELRERVAAAERTLEQMRQELNKPIVLPAASPAVSTPATPPVLATSPVATKPMFSKFDVLLAALALGVSVAAGVWIASRRGARRGPPTTSASTTQASPVLQSPAPAPAQPPAQITPPVVNQPQRGAAPVMSTNWSDVSDLATEPADVLTGKFAYQLSEEDTVVLEQSYMQDTEVTAVLPAPVNTQAKPVDRAFLVNPEATLNTTHVTLGSDLHEAPVFTERRKNPADILRQAIEREPGRTDLRLKLLEIYYIAAAQNQRAFLEVARELARNDKFTSAKEWSQIVDMGRKIAPGDEMFRDSHDDQAVA